jgi:hypothetical protein
MYPQLIGAVEQRRLATSFPNQDLFFTAAEAAQMGLKLDQGWMLKISPTEAGELTFSRISPTKWEITEDNYYISPSGERYPEADMRALLSDPSGEVVPDELFYQPKVTVENLTEAGREQYQEYQAAGGELGVADWVNLRERQQLETEEVFGAVFPEQDISEVIEYMQSDPEGFLSDIREIGPTEEMVTLLKSLKHEDEEGNLVSYTDEDIAMLFEGIEGVEWVTPETLGMPETEYTAPPFRGFTIKPEGWPLIGMITDPTAIKAQVSLIEEIKSGLIASDVVPEYQREILNSLPEGILPKTYLTLNVSELKQLGVNLEEQSAWHLDNIQKYTQDYGYWESLITTEEYQPSFWAKYEAGWGDLIRTAGTTMRWLGAEGIGESISEAGEYSLVVPPAEWKGVFHSNFWTGQLPRALPFTLALIPAAIIGGYAGAGVAGVVGLGALGKTILGSIGAAALSRPLESALEAGSAYDTALTQGLSREDANEAADSVFKKNMALGGMDATEFFLAFAPTPFKTGGKLIRYAMIAGKLTAVGLSEMGEEALQDIFIRQALGEEIKLDAEMQQAMSLGFVMGVGLGGVGEVFTTIQTRVKENLTPGLTEVFETAKFDALEEGKSLKASELAGLDAVAKTGEGKALVEKIVNEVQESEQAKQNSTFNIGNIADTEMTVGELGLNYDKLPQDVRSQLESFKAGKENFSNYTVYDFARFINSQFTEIGKTSALLRWSKNSEIQKIFAFWASEKGIFSSSEADAISRELASQPRIDVMREISERGAPEAGIALDELQAELDAAQEWLGADPVAKHTGKEVTYTRKGKKVTRKYKITSMLVEGKMPETLTPQKARYLLMGRELKRGAFDKAGNVRWEYIIDELAEHFHMGEQELVNRIEQIARTERRVTELKSLVRDAEARIQAEAVEPNPRNTVRHPDHIKSEEAGNIEVAREFYDAVPNNELDVAATTYLQEGAIDSYISRMPEYDELKLQALSDEVRANIAEVVELQNLGNKDIARLTQQKYGSPEQRAVIESEISRLTQAVDFFDGLVRKLKGGDRLTVDDAIHLGMALRKTKGGKLIPAVRDSGFYVSTDFADYPFFQNVGLPSGMLMDTIRLLQAVDGGRFAGAAQRHILWPTQRTYLAYLQFVDTSKAQVHELAEKYGLTGFQMGKARDAAGDVVEYIGQVESMQTAQELMREIPEIAALIEGFDSQTQQNIIDFAREARHFFDNMLDIQNRARAKRKQDTILYRRNYRQWVTDTNLWAMLFGRNKRPDVMMQTVPMPDYIKPDAPFNPRAEARKGGLADYLKKRDLVQLMYDYSVTAGKDLFMTNIVQNGKIHTATLRSMGHESSAALIEDWISEAYAGVTPSISRAASRIIPRPALKFGFWLRRQLTRAVFPLNWTWNVFVQTSSIALTTTRYGMVNTIRGLDYLLVPSVHRQVRQNAYSSIIKGRRGGKIAYQDIGARVEKSLRWEGSTLEKVENITNFLTNAIENFLTGVSIRAAYHHGQKLGYKGRALWEYASEGGAKTQSMYNLENLPGILRNKEVGTLFPFQTFSLEVFNTVREINLVGVRKLVGKAGAYETITATSAEGQATIRNRTAMLLRWFAAMIVINMVADKFINRKPWRLSSFIPFFSLMGAGMDSNNPWYLPMPLQYINDLKGAISDVIKYDNWTDLRQWATRYHVLGGTQINRMLDAVQSLIHGEWADARGKQLFEVDPDEWLTALTRGIYSTKGGRDYIDQLNEKKGAWYEFLGFALPERVNITNEIDNELAKLGEIEEDGSAYDFADFVSALRQIRQQVGDNRFNKADSPFITGFLEAETVRAEFEDLPYQPIHLMDSEDWDSWLHYQTLTGEERAQFAEDNPEVLQTWRGQYYNLWQEYTGIETKKERDAFLEAHPELTKVWRKEWRTAHPQQDAMLAFWGFPGRLQTREAYNQVVKWAKEYNVPLEHLTAWLPPENLANDYFDYLGLSDEFGSSSAEVKLFRLEHPEFNEWGIDAYGWKESALKDANVDVLRIQVKHRHLFDQYDAFGDDDSPQYIADDNARATARTEFLNTHPDFRDDRNRLEVFQAGGSAELAELNVEYGRIVEEFGSNTAEAKLWRLEHPEFTNWAMEQWGWEGTEDYKGIEYYQLQVKWRDKEAEYNAIEGDVARKEFLEANKDYWTAKLTMQAMDYEMPDDYIPLYVQYYQMPVAGYDRERFLNEHQDYYDDVWKGILGNQEIEFGQIPTVEEEKLLDYYDSIDSDNATARLQARCKDAELDAALVSLRGLKPAYGTDRCGSGESTESSSPWEELAEVEQFQELF